MPLGWGISHEPTKGAAQMRLVAHAALQGDLRQGIAGRDHQVLRESNALSHDVSGGRRPKGRFEGPEKMRGAQLHQPGQIAGFEGRSDVCSSMYVATRFACQAARPPRGGPGVGDVRCPTFVTSEARASSSAPCAFI
jgi:hypothetical protein